MNDNLYLIVLVLITSAANILGGVLITLKKNWTRNALNAFMALGSGFLLAIAIIELLPESLSVSASNAYYILAGFITVYLFQHVLSKHFHFGEETHHGHEHGSKFGVMLGMLTHTFFDGVAIASGFEVNVTVGALVFFAVLLHKIPDGVTIASITLAKNGSRKLALLSAIYLGLSTFAGALTVIFLGEFVHMEGLTAIALAFSAGVFIYVGGTDLLPAVNATEDRKNSLFVILGILIFLGSSFLFHEVSGEHDQEPPVQQETPHGH